MAGAEHGLPLVLAAPDRPGQAPFHIRPDRQGKEPPLTTDFSHSQAARPGRLFFRRGTTIAQALTVEGLIKITPEGIWFEPVDWPLWLLRYQSGSTALGKWIEGVNFDAPMEHLYGLPLIDASVSQDPDKRHLCKSLVNNSQTQDVDEHLSLVAGQVAAQKRQNLLHHADPMAMKSATGPANDRLQSRELALNPSDLHLECSAHSHQGTRLRIGS